jgi:hypothetical protein
MTESQTLYWPFVGFLALLSRREYIFRRPHRVPHKNQLGSPLASG